MRNLQQGFTLIELVVVIVILGILAAVAAPKFIDVSSDAYLAKVKAAEGSLKSANSLVFSKAVIHNLDLGDAALSIDGAPLNITNGYIRPTATDIGTALDVEFEVLRSITDSFSKDYGIHDAGAGVISILAKPQSVNNLQCGLMYNFDTSTPAGPVYRSFTNCG